MSAELLARLGGPVAAGGLALLILASPRQARAGGLILVAAGTGLFVPILAPSGEGARLVAAAIVAVVLAVGLAVLFDRRPWALGVLALLAAPARIPVPLGGDTANLLLPLYLVVAGAAVWLGWSLWRDPVRRRELGPVSWPLAGFVAWLGLSALWTNDPERGAVQVLAFIVPFALLTIALARLPWSERALAWLCRLLLAMAMLFSGVGIWQWTTKNVFWNPKVIADNTFASFYRVNSLFWDPSIYGRFLVVAILVALTLLLFGPWRRFDVPLALVIVVLWVGLLFSFSQSSFAALIAGLLVAGVLAWRSRAGALVSATAAIVIMVGLPSLSSEDAGATLVAAPQHGLNRVTRGRFDLVKNGIHIALDHPIAGVGVGGFEKAYKERVQVPRANTPASHNTPVTVAAETGVVGLALFVWFLAAALAIAFKRAAAGPTSVRVAGLAAGLGITAIFVHSLFYNAFFEDPFTWGFLGLATLAARESLSRG
jgi:putative inorganic carbon (HCO3(-)) transporter